MLVEQQIFCPIRKKWVIVTPEELVRNQWIHHLTVNLGYPIERIGVEKGLRQMPHLTLSPQKLPTRRADLIIFDKNISPFILVEFKAIPLSDKAWRQVIGYNFYLGAPYFALVNGDEIRFGRKNEGSYLSDFPSFEALNLLK